MQQCERCCAGLNKSERKARHSLTSQTSAAAGDQKLPRLVFQVAQVEGGLIQKLTQVTLQSDKVWRPIGLKILRPISSLGNQEISFYQFYRNWMGQKRHWGLFSVDNVLSLNSWNLDRNQNLISLHESDGEKVSPPQLKKSFLWAFYLMDWWIQGVILFSRTQPLLLNLYKHQSLHNKY